VLQKLNKDLIKNPQNH